MKTFTKTKSRWWPVLTLGFLLVALWGNLLINTFLITDTNTAVADHQNPGTAAYEEILPNFLAPVIRKDVENSSSDEETFALKISFSRLDYLFKVWQ